MFIEQLNGLARTDIKRRLESTLQYEFGYPSSDSVEWCDMNNAVEEAMQDKVSNVVPQIEWTEWSALDYELRTGIYFAGDEDSDEYITKMLDLYSEYQANRAKRLGY